MKIFLYLQVLDLLTTLVGLRMGLAEASPFVRLLMQVGPAAGLLISKCGALCLAGFCVWLERERVIRWISYWYALLVVWNLCLLLVHPAA